MPCVGWPISMELVRAASAWSPEPDVEHNLGQVRQFADTHWFRAYANPGGCFRGFPSHREGLGYGNFSRGALSGPQCGGPSIRHIFACVSLSTVFEGRGDEKSIQSMEALSLGLDSDPARRSSINDLEALLSDILGEPIPPPPPPPARFWTEDQTISFRGHSYRIVSRLGSGGVGTTFKVVKIDPQTRNDLGTYVAKVARDEEMGRRILAAYELAHSHLRHSALSTFSKLLPNGR